jgi:hypothetical protein
VGPGKGCAGFRSSAGALNRKPAKPKTGLHEVRSRILAQRKRVEAGAQELERLQPQRGDQTVLGAEQAVDGARGRSYLVGDSAHQQRVRTAHFDSSLGGG